MFDIYRGNLKISLPDEVEWKKWDELGIKLLYAEGPEKPPRRRSREKEGN